MKRGQAKRGAGESSQALNDQLSVLVEVCRSSGKVDRRAGAGGDDPGCHGPGARSVGVLDPGEVTVARDEKVVTVNAPGVGAKSGKGKSGGLRALLRRLRGR